MIRRFLTGAALALVVTVAAESPELATLNVEHPRLLLPQARLEGLVRLAETDGDLRRMAGEIEAQAREWLDAPPLQRELKGPRLLAVSRECLDRVYTLALAWRWTGEQAFADGAIANLKTVSAFQDWNPSHFLDVAEMTHAVAIGYDWLYHEMDEATRAEIRGAIIRHGLEPGLRAYESGAWWVKSEYNWNQVCNSGLLIGALAIAETDPAYGEKILPAAIQSLPKALAAYEPEGVWNEGPAYWHYATRYTAYGLSALETALGTDFGLGDREGLRETAWFPLFTTGPTGLFLNFADSGSNSRRKPMPCLFWLSARYRMAPVAALEHRLLDTEPADPLHLVWYVPRPEENREPAPLDRLFRGEVPVVVSRSSWDDPRALFVGVKGGFNQVNHGQLDLGNFELDALGVRWARDLGSDNYNLDGYFDRKPGGKRWNYYRNVSQSHNVPLINGAGQAADGRAILVKHTGGETGSRTVLDLSAAYPEHAVAVFRGVAVLNGRRSVLVQDEFQLKAPATLTWGMTTDAEIEIADPKAARLHQNGETLKATILSPAAATFGAESAEQQPPQHENRGVRRLVATVPPGETAVTVVVHLEPAWPEGEDTEVPGLVPLEKW